MPKTSTEEEKVFLTTSQLLEGTTLPNDNLTGNITLLLSFVFTS